MEIEAKIPVTADQALALRERLGAPVATHRQRDIYLATAGLPVALRVRQDDAHAWVTLKSGFTQVEGIKVREELEPVIRPEDVPTWLAIFERLGLPEGLTVSKHRDEYAYGGVHVLLDTVDELGTFVEVEAVADDAPAALVKLEAAIRDLGLGELPRVSESYRELLIARKAGS